MLIQVEIHCNIRGFRGIRMQLHLLITFFVHISHRRMFMFTKIEDLRFNLLPATCNWQLTLFFLMSSFRVYIQSSTVRTPTGKNHSVWCSLMTSFGSTLWDKLCSKLQVSVAEWFPNLPPVVTLQGEVWVHLNECVFFSQHSFGFAKQKCANIMQYVLKAASCRHLFHLFCWHVEYKPCSSRIQNRTWLLEFTVNSAGQTCLFCYWSKLCFFICTLETDEMCKE